MLHAHLPFIRHPEHAQFLEEQWLFECLTESYLPLLDVLNRLANSGMQFKLCLSISPTLQSMLSDDLLMHRYDQYLQRLESIVAKEMVRTILNPRMHRLAGMYKTRLKRIKRQFYEDYSRNILFAFRQLSDRNYIELITSSATHAFLPLLQRHPCSVNAQLQMANKTHQRLMGQTPPGIWLPECGYYQGLEQNLAQLGISYFFMDAHGLALAHPPAENEVFSPIKTNTNVAVFARDLEISRLVWSAQGGYPGHPDYREFYKTLEHDLDDDIIREYLGPDFIGKNTGIKYHRITGKTENKELYIPEYAYKRAITHAGDIYSRIVSRMTRAKQLMPDTEPVMVAPFDAELFGHWWFEGPYFLEELIRLLSQGKNTDITTDTPSEYLCRQTHIPRARPAESSWGQGGYNSVWLNPKTDWIYNHLDRAATRMEKISNDNPSAVGTQRQALNQAARELMLAQSSDWAFIIKTGTSVGYAFKAIRDHILGFTRLADEIDNGTIDVRRLETQEKRNNIFPDMDYRLFSSKFTSSRDYCNKTNAK